MKRAHNHKGDFLRVRLVLVADQTVEGDQVQSGDTNECVDDSGKGGAGSEQSIYKIKIKDSDDTPNDRPNDHKSKTNNIKYFHGIPL